MCGRFNVIDNPGLRALLKDLGIDLTLPSAANVAPTEDVQLLRDRGTERTLETARWWLTPSWARAVDQKYAMFNARSESLSTSRAFRHPFKSQRGVVPMSGFIEWRKEGNSKQPWLISNEESALAIAALWDVWSRDDTTLLSCTLVTTAAAADFAPWHHRMPVMLTLRECERWLDGNQLIDSEDPLFRDELKYPLILKALPEAIGNARNKDLSMVTAKSDQVHLLGGTTVT
ncbi:MAG: SOS response-associated peptidase [Pseudomonadota bacterium]